MSHDPAVAAIFLLESLIEHLESASALRSGDTVAIYDGALLRLLERRKANGRPTPGAVLARRRSG